MEIRLNIGYFKSFQGIIKIVQLVRTSKVIPLMIHMFNLITSDLIYLFSN